MPKSWDEASVEVVFVWSHSSVGGSSFDVRWGARAIAVGDNDALDGVAFTASGEVTDTGGVTNNLYRSGTTGAFAINGSPSENDSVVFEVFRNAIAGADTLPIDARLHGVALYYTTNANTDN
jgi:hypothetical protein